VDTGFPARSFPKRTWANMGKIEFPRIITGTILRVREALMRVNAIKQAALLCVLSFSLAGIGAAEAQTKSYAEAISQLAAACGRDVARYCKGVPLGGGLKNCLDGHASVLSPGCAQTRAAVYDSISRRAAAQRNIGEVCEPDIERLCGTSHADSHLVECLQMTSPTAISPRCNQAFMDSGWRTEKAQQ
jgi:hypothetical protein